MDLNTYLNLLIARFEANAKPENAGPMKRYMKNRYEFFGIKTPERNAILKEFLAENGLPPQVQLEELVRKLWEVPQREIQIVALSYLERNLKKLEKGSMALIEHLIITKSWWDTVDPLATKLAGALMQKYPELISDYAEKWIHSDNFWLQRSALLFQLKYKNKTDEELLYRYIREVADSREFFIRKAIGWVLREYSKANPESVIRFIENTQLSPLSRREGLKHINRVNERLAEAKK